MTSSTPACLPIAFAVRSLSPVSMTTRMPMFCSSRTACGLSSLITSATAITPSNFPSRLKYRGVLPASLQVCACCLICGDLRLRADEGIVAAAKRLSFKNCFQAVSGQRLKFRHVKRRKLTLERAL